MSTLGDPIVLGLLLGTVGGLAVVVFSLLRFRPSRSDRAPVVQTRPDRRAQRLDEAVAGSPMLRRAVEATTNLASRGGFLGRAERSLRAADVPARPAEMILAHLSLTIVVPIATFAMTRSAFLTALGLLFAAAGPVLALRFISTRRRKRFALQLPDALTALAGSLRAGRSIGQAMETLSREFADPIGRELRKVVAETRLGRPQRDALADAAERADSADFKWAVLAMQIQAEIGGNLAELLDQVASTMRERSRMRGEVKALTAEGRASALMLVILVPGLGLFMTAVNRQYMEPLFSTSIGQILVGVSVLMITGGYLWMNKMVKIDV